MLPEVSGPEVFSRSYRSTSPIDALEFWAIGFNGQVLILNGYEILHYSR